ncbi:MAG: hypothetical protein RLZZ598_168 [Pseudomonadota bacterium]|jgi:uncharacterized membrane protein YebE (DUF533 family)
MSQTRFPLYVLALATVMLAGGASAQTAAAPSGTNTPRIDQRQANQERRIDQGVASGALTARETQHLDQQQHRIDNMENRAKADGNVSAAERRHINKAQNHASRNIRRQKHDGQHVGQKG